MTFKLQILLLICFLIALISIINLCRNKKLDLKQGLPWILVLVVLIVFVIFPSFLEYLAVILGIETPINMLVVFGFVFASLLILSLTILVSNLSKSVKSLTQKIALMDEEIKEIIKDKHEV